MASLDDYPINDVVSAIRRVNDRLWDRSGRLFAEVGCSLPIDDARFICAAALWIDVLITAEVKTDKDADFSLDELFWLIKEKAQAMKLQAPTDKWIWLVGPELKMMMSIEMHLDRYASRGTASATKGRSNWKKGKKN